MFKGSLVEHFSDSYKRLKRHNKDEDATAEYFSKNIQPTVSFYKKEKPHFTDSHGNEYFISSGQDSDAFYEKGTSQKLSLDVAKDNDAMAWGEQMIFFKTKKSVRENQGAPETGKYVKLESDSGVMAICKVNEVYLGLNRATGYMVAEVVTSGKSE